MRHSLSMTLLRFGNHNNGNNNNKDQKVSGRPPRFELIAGSVCLDFVNTLDDRPTKPRELLTHYRDLVRFGEAAGLLKPSQLRRLLKRSATDPHGAQQALRRARELREAIHDVFWPIIHKRSEPAAALAKLNASVQ